MEILDGSDIVVWFSCGAASAVAAKRTIEKYGATCNIRVVNNPIAEEHPDNRRFLMDVERWLGITIEVITNADYPNHSCVEIWGKRRFMSGPKGAPCTMLLKKEARYKFEAANHIDWHVLGFTADEKNRSDTFMLTERRNLIPVLIDDNLTKDDCFGVLLDAGIELPQMYLLGYPNANCIGCVKATSPTYWNHVRVVHPDVWSLRAAQSREIGCKLARYKNKRVFLDELPPDAKGKKMKQLKSIECGIFCEEKPLAKSAGIDRALELINKKG